VNNKQHRTILITGGAGFIGSHVVRHFVNSYPDYNIKNLDALTYAGNLESLADVEGARNYSFIKGDITDQQFIDSLFQNEEIDSVIHLAAESHVDRSIQDPLIFVKVNVLGTANLLNAARRNWNSGDGHLFYHVSTDEVYGSLGDEGYFRETTPYDPRSPYSASKAGSDHLVRSYHHTFGLPVVISNCSNNYGPFQFPEKLIPLTINNILNKKEIPVYGKGENVRDWLYVEDHVKAIDTIFHSGVVGETYNVGGDNEWKNIELVRLLCDVVDEIMGNAAGASQELITFVKDRAGHDHRYAIDFSKLREKTGWKPAVDFREGLRSTVSWYIDNKKWVEHVTSGEYLRYYEEQYLKR
jgi:dTDP-glucose 4,6-dehydratase